MIIARNMLVILKIFEAIFLLIEDAKGQGRPVN